MAAFTVEDLASKLSTAGLDNYTIKLEKDSTNRKTLLKIKKNSSVKLENKKLEGKINFYDITVGKITLNISDKGPSFDIRFIQYLCKRRKDIFGKKSELISYYFHTTKKFWNIDKCF